MALIPSFVGRLFRPAQKKDASASYSAPASVPGGGGWFPIIRESRSGDWQKGIAEPIGAVLKSPAAFSCITLIAADIGKLALRINQRVDLPGGSHIWQPANVPAFSPVLRNPNRYQTTQQFVEAWLTTKLIFGNAYALISRDNRGVVVALYLLDPSRVIPLVAPDGEVFYQLYTDRLAGLNSQGLVVPSSEIIHDRMNCFFHPLVGLSPLYSSDLPAAQGLQIQRDSVRFFRNNSAPGGVLTAPGKISDVLAERVKRYWSDEFTNENAGEVAILGEGMTFSPLRMTSVDAQAAEQTTASALQVCATFHVPAYLAGIGPMPANPNVEALTQAYLSQCLQAHINAVQNCLNDGLGISNTQYTVRFDIDDLLQMDGATLMTTLRNGVAGAIMTPNEARLRLNLPPIDGGSTIYMQVQNYSVEALAKRDAEAAAPGTTPQSTDGTSTGDGSPPAGDSPGDSPGDTPGDTPAVAPKKSISAEDDFFAMLREVAEHLDGEA